MRATLYLRWGAAALAALCHSATAQDLGEAPVSAPNSAATPAPPGSAPTTAQVPRVTPGMWVVMGSSSALGVGGGPGRGWSALLQAHMHEHGVSLLNMAKGGATSYAGISTSQPPVPLRPPPDTEINIDTVISLQPRLIIISYPSNDTANGYAVEETVRNLESIRQQAAKRRVPVVVMSTQPRPLPAEQLALMTQLDQRLREVFAPCFVDVQAVLAAPGGRMAKEFDAGDGTHPNVLGHERIYAEVLRLLESKSCVLVGKS